MPDDFNLLWLILLLPLLGAILTVPMGVHSLKKFSHLPCVLGALGAAAVSLYHLDELSLQNGYRSATGYVTWFEAGGITVRFSISTDPLTAIMLCAITGIGSLIAIFSIGYMHDDEGYPRYFALVSLFIFNMCLLVSADNLLVLFAGWEGVGLCSYLLVGYWYAKPSAASAARKAFLVTRLGDLGLILGIFLLWQLVGPAIWSFQTLFDSSLLRKVAEEHPEQLATACLLLFCGAVGKSAQFPLYVWLPDAMEGPTPVSALIHAATMVTAGVYLLARTMPLFVLCPDVQKTVAMIGVLTAFIAAFIALTQFDLKRVLAYSTVSQLGFMFFALGCATPKTAGFAVTAAIFHLFTHAFFKAVLFLAAGSVMHSMGNVIDMRRFSGLKSVMPLTHAAFLAGAAALAGFPLLSGFWSKDMILESAVLASETGGSLYVALLIVALITAGLTAFYSTRAYIKTFHGPLTTPSEAGDHPHESPPVMTGPLLLLAIGAVFVGIILGPTEIFSNFLLKGRSLQVAASFAEPVAVHTNWLLVLGSITVALGGVYLGFLFYMKSPQLAVDIPNAAQPAYQLSLDRLYVDEIYEGTVVRLLNLSATISKGVEAVIDGLTSFVAAIPAAFGALVRPAHALVQLYALTMVSGLVVFLGYMVFGTGR